VVVLKLNVLWKIIPGQASLQDVFVETKLPSHLIFTQEDPYLSSSQKNRVYCRCCVQTKPKLPSHLIFTQEDICLSSSQKNRVYCRCCDPFFLQLAHD
jgi:hypothetical protein